MYKILGITVLVLALLLPVAPASAATISVTERITIRASVAEAIYIITDSRGGIIQIVSNTPRTITPVVYSGSVRQGNKRTLTPETYAAYRKLVPQGKHRMGILYERSQLTVQQIITIKRQA